MEHVQENLDFLAFAIGAIAMFGLLDRWIGRKALGSRRVVPPLAWALLGGLLIGGAWMTDRLGHDARDRVERTMVGYAPTYADALERMGHASVSLDTAADDPAYLAMIDAQRRWVELNPAVADVYTLRRDAAGMLRLVVDAETDYDRDGRYAGDRESRTDIGETLDAESPALDAAFAGHGGFDAEIETDRWGTWVSAYWPVYDAQGRVDAVLGIDYDAGDWAREIRKARWTALAVTAVLVLMLGGATAAFALRGIELETRRRHADAMAAARDAAESASALKSQFLARMSHEIRTPINGVMGVTELLLQTALDAKQQHFGELIYRSATTLLDVINDILDYSKIEAGKLVLECIDFTPGEIFEDVTELLAARAQIKGLDLNLDLPVDDGSVLRGDPARLRQVVTNLVGNAIKFTEVGEVTVRGRWASDGDTVRLHCEVLDTGHGIDESSQSSLFEPFVQADSSTTRRFGGTGLGLAICRRLIEAMDGRIGCAARPGGGSVFSFEVPLLRGTPRTEAAPGRATGQLGLRGVKVLIVDDNATNREILEHLCAAWGMRFTAVADGPAALEALGAAVNDGQPFEAAILDLDMPGMDGLELARFVHAQPRLAATRLLMLSSVCHLSGEETWRAAGITHYLNKPVRQQHLFRALADALGAGAQALAAPSFAAGLQAAELPHFSGRVLIAEDNAVNRLVAQSTLEALGLDVDTVVDGRAAVDALCGEGRLYAAVLMDCEMPELDGRAATAAIRAFESSTRRPRVPIIALTAHALESDRRLCVEAGMDDYLSKPFSRQQLGAMLARWIAPASPPAHPAAPEVTTPRATATV